MVRVCVIALTIIPMPLHWERKFASFLLKKFFTAKARSIRIFGWTLSYGLYLSTLLYMPFQRECRRKLNIFKIEESCSKRKCSKRITLSLSSFIEFLLKNVILSQVMTPFSISLAAICLSKEKVIGKSVLQHQKGL